MQASVLKGEENKHGKQVAANQFIPWDNELVTGLMWFREPRKGHTGKMSLS